MISNPIQGSRNATIGRWETPEHGRGGARPEHGESLSDKVRQDESPGFREQEGQTLRNPRPTPQPPPPVSARHTEEK